MKKLLILSTAAAAITFCAPTLSNAQIGIDVPGVGVRVGEPNRDRGVYRDRREFREREVRGSEGCKTVTVERDDGSVKRIRKCN